ARERPRPVLQRAGDRSLLRRRASHRHRAAGSGEVIVETLVPGAIFTASAPAAPVPALTAALVSAPAAALAPTAPMPESPSALPLREDTSGIYLQLGAFANYANAENFLQHVESQVVW